MEIWRPAAHETGKTCNCDAPAHGYALDDFVNDLEGLLAAWGVTGPVHLFGNSFGGTIAYFLAFHIRTIAWQMTLFELMQRLPLWRQRFIERNVANEDGDDEDVDGGDDDDLDWEDFEAGADDDDVDPDDEEVVDEEVDDDAEEDDLEPSIVE